MEEKRAKKWKEIKLIKRRKIVKEINKRDKMLKKMQSGFLNKHNFNLK